MKTFLLPTILGLLIAASAFGEGAQTNITVRLDKVWTEGTRTSLWFNATATINNHTGSSLVVSNLYSELPGLALKVTDLNDTELKRTYAAPFKDPAMIIPLGRKTHRLYYLRSSVAVPETTEAVRVQLEGVFSGRVYSGTGIGYSGGLTSNVVEVKIP
jgi:hypothetical protein